MVIAFYPFVFLTGSITDDIFLGGQNSIVRHPVSPIVLWFAHALLDVLSAALDAGLALSVITIFFVYVISHHLR